MNLSLITAPTMEPVSLESAKLHARIDSALENSIVESQIVAARERAEVFTGRQLITATWELWLEDFPDQRWIEVPLPPLKTVTHVKYYDSDGVLQTFSSGDYSVITPSGPHCLPGVIWLKATASWPYTYCYHRPDAVQVRFVAGYGATGADVPQSIRQAMLLHITDHFDNRSEASGTASVDALLWPFRVFA
jgi:uncharacterized phiE125 gp8 family phage protein